MKKGFNVELNGDGKLNIKPGQTILKIFIRLLKIAYTEFSFENRRSRNGRLVVLWMLILLRTIHLYGNYLKKQSRTMMELALSLESDTIYNQYQKSICAMVVETYYFKKNKRVGNSLKN